MDADDIFEAYASPALAQMPAELKLDPGNRLLPVDFGYVTINYDKAYFAENDVPLPSTLRDLADPAYESLLVVENPATSSPGLSFLLTGSIVVEEIFGLPGIGRPLRRFRHRRLGRRHRFGDFLPPQVSRQGFVL